MRRRSVSIALILVVCLTMAITGGIATASKSILLLYRDPGFDMSVIDFMKVNVPQPTSYWIPGKGTIYGNVFDDGTVDPWGKPALKFNGGYVVDMSFHAPSGSRSRTIVAYVYPTNLGVGTRVIFRYWRSGALDHQMTIRDRTPWTYQFPCDVPASTQVLENNQWYVIANVYDYSRGTMTYYVNGEVAGSYSGVCAGTDYDNPALVSVGADDEGGIRNALVGYISGIYYWNNVVLTPEQIQKLAKIGPVW